MCKLVSFEIERLQGINRRMISTLLKGREHDYSTALSHFVAVPHFKLDGENKFYLVIIRCKNGIYFSSLYPSIKAVFAFATSRDQRAAHLDALSRIVKITGQSSFESRWLEAQTPEKIRRIFIKTK